jgi:hypothetical protein
VNDRSDKLTLCDILGGTAPEKAPEEDVLAQYVEVTPRALAMLNLRDCKEQLDRWKSDRLRLAQAAKSAHLALQAALTDALAGSAGVGAYDDKLRAAYLAYYDEAGAGEAMPPKSDYVMRFDDLLTRAIEHPMEWSGKTLKVSADEREALKRLTIIRHRVEHPRPQFHFIEPRFIAQTLPVAARLALDLLDVCFHRYEGGERDAVVSSVADISATCAQIE